MILRMQSPILSIIVPVYNVKPYLRKCVESLLPYAPLPEGKGVGQDLDPAEYEIILVDDGSTDGSGELADELAQSPITSHKSQITNHKSQIIQVIHQANKGLSEARNTGIRAARGKYIQFVDSDDYLEPNVLGKLVAQMEREELDVLRFDYQNVRIVPTIRAGLYNPALMSLPSEQGSTIRTCDATGNEVNSSVANGSITNSSLEANSSASSTYQIFEPNKTPRQVDHCTDIVTGEEYLNTRMGYACYVSQFLIRRTLLICDAEPNAAMAGTTPQPEEKMMFLKGVYFEDTEWTPRMLLTAKRVNSSTTIAYNYLMRTGSITKAVSKEKQLKVVNDKLIVIESLCRTMANAKDKRWLRGMISLMALGMLSGVAQHGLNARSYVRQLRSLGAFPLHADKVSKSAKRKMKITNFCPYLYVMLMRH